MTPGILSIDIGGSGLKADVVDDQGNMLADRVRVPTPRPAPPEVVVAAIVEMVRCLPAYDRISIGFPGVVRDGKVLTAVNLEPDAWLYYPLADTLSQKLGGHPARLLNDADMQGYALVSGEGIELAVTLGTGFGSALFRDGELMPHMELAHHPFRKGLSYEHYLSDANLKRVGKKRWNGYVLDALQVLYNLLLPDRIYIGGGNTRMLAADLPAYVVVGSNDAGIEGGAALWKRERKTAAVRKPG